MLVAGAHGIVIVYDVTDLDSFRAVETWMTEVDKFASGTVTKLLVGNKIDLASQRKVSTEQGLSLAKQYGIKFLETSAKTSTNVLECFNAMTEEVYLRVAKGVTPKTEGTCQASLCTQAPEARSSWPASRWAKTPWRRRALVGMFGPEIL